MSTCNSDPVLVSGDKVAALQGLIQGSGSTPVYVFFYSPTCPHCQTLDDAFQRYRAQCQAQKAKAVLVIANLQTAPEVFKRFDVTSFPQVMVFQGGKRVKHIVGADLPALACAFRMAGLQLGPRPAAE